MDAMAIKCKGNRTHAVPFTLYTQTKQTKCAEKQNNILKKLLLQYIFISFAFNSEYYKPFGSKNNKQE